MDKHESLPTVSVDLDKYDLMALIEAAKERCERGGLSGDEDNDLRLVHKKLCDAERDLAEKVNGRG